MSNVTHNLVGFEVVGTVILTAHDGEEKVKNGLMFSEGVVLHDVPIDQKILLLIEMRKLIEHMIANAQDFIKSEAN